jgi:septal ring factor EnvC (AmiA/AmiB activator)
MSKHGTVACDVGCCPYCADERAHCRDVAHLWFQSGSAFEAAVLLLLRERAAVRAECSRAEPVRCGVHDVSLERDGEYHGDCVACRLESERAGLEQDLAAAKEERNELQDAVDGLQETLDRSREEWATAMEREIGRRETELSTLRQRVAELEAEESRLRLRVEELEVKYEVWVMS